MGFDRRFVLGSRVDATTYETATLQIIDWAARGESRMVCAAPVHMIMEAYDSADFRSKLNSADLVTPDGVPVAWAMRWLGLRQQGRVCGPDLTEHVCRVAASSGLAVGFYGGTEQSLGKLVSNLTSKFPGLRISYQHSPPFRQLSHAEDEAVVSEVNESGAKVLFVGLGCPKQENWMHDHRGRISAVMLGVGAAFDFHAGTLRRAPAWMQRAGLEWVFRLAVNPRRLFMRYLKHNPRYLWLVLLQAWGLKKYPEFTR